MASNHGDKSETGSDVAVDKPFISSVQAAMQAMVLKLKATRAKPFFDSPHNIRIATLCSGTEAPIFALDEIQDAIAKLGFGNLVSYDHLFSCEIVPFKQAFIRRNTKQNVIFRDVVELGRSETTEATVAGGYTQPIPQKIDILIAGCSCVDYSSLNNTGKEKAEFSSTFFSRYPKERRESPTNIHHGEQDPEFVASLNACLKDAASLGESARTFLSAISFIVKQRPLIIVLENVVGAKWQEYVNFWFPMCGYAAEWIKLDTKDYGLPQTRNRGYLIAVSRLVFPAADQITADWKKHVSALACRSLATIDDFLLPADDPRIVVARSEMESSTMAEESIDGKVVRWEHCRMRHEKRRRQKGISNDDHPVTGLEENRGHIVHVQPRQESWIAWFEGQPPRVLDLVDICIAEGIKENVDYMFKSAVFDLSQNVDRKQPTVGVSPCITPSGIPFLTRQLRPLTGIEALILQGLPKNKLILSTEKQADLLDLSGNAMTVPVVGAVLLAAYQAVEDHKPASFSYYGNDPLVKGPGDEHLGKHDQSKISGESNSHTKVDLTRTLLPRNVFGRAIMHETRGPPHDLTGLVTNGKRFCFCQNDVYLKRNAYIGYWCCVDCGTTACDDCKGNPVHKFEELRNIGHIISRSEVQGSLSHYLPSAFSFTATGKIPSGADANVLLADRFYLTDIRITEIINVEYRSASGVARLEISEEVALWYLFIDAHTALGAKYQREGVDASHPVARGLVKYGKGSNANLLTESVFWEIWVKQDSPLQLTVQHDGDIITIKDINDVLACLPQDVIRSINRKVPGVYKAKKKCGTAEQSLYVRTGFRETSKTFLFKDCTTTGPKTDDHFVFAESCRALQPYEFRDPIVNLGHELKPHKIPLDDKIDAYVLGFWDAIEGLVMRPFNCAKFHFGNELAALAMQRACDRSQPVPLLRIRLELVNFPRPQSLGFAWDVGTKQSIPPTSFEDFTRIIRPAIFKISELGRAIDIPAHLRGEQELEVTTDECRQCCLAAPNPLWVPQASSRTDILPYFTRPESEAFEKRCMALPQPLTIMVRLSKLDDNHAEQQPEPAGEVSRRVNLTGMLEVDIGMVCGTLPRRALSHLIFSRRVGRRVEQFLISNSRMYYQANFQHGLELASKLSRFTARLAQTDCLIGLTAQFWEVEKRCELLPQKLVSFRKNGKTLIGDQPSAVQWMIEREMRPQPFPETEIEEEVFDLMYLRMTGKAVVMNNGSMTCSKGGVVAHHVGYGKTVITMALIDHQTSYDRTTSLEEREKVDEIFTTDLVEELNQPRSRCFSSYIHLSATLIIVPPAILYQWEKEVEAFLGQNRVILSFARFADLQKSSVEKIKKADVILVSNTVFEEKEYAAQLRFLSGWRTAGNINWGRQYREWYKDALTYIRRGLYLHYNSQGGEDANSKTQAIFDGFKTARDEALKKKLGNEILKERSSNSIGQRKWDIPILEFFSYARIVYDEFAYEKLPVADFVANSLASSRWLLSGTPPMSSLADICFAAYMLGIHVARPEPCILPGLPLITRGPPAEELNPCEQFRSLSGKVKSLKFVEERHKQAELFIDHFYRANSVRHGAKIETKYQIHRVVLAPAERVAYTELHQELVDCHMKYEELWKGTREFLTNDVDLGSNNLTQESLGLRASGSVYHILRHSGMADPATNTTLSLTYMQKSAAERLATCSESTKCLFDKMMWLLRRVTHQAEEMRDLLKSGASGEKQKAKTALEKTESNIEHVTYMVEKLIAPFTADTNLRNAAPDCFGDRDIAGRIVRVLCRPGFDFDERPLDASEWTPDAWAAVGGHAKYSWYNWFDLGGAVDVLGDFEAQELVKDLVRADISEVAAAPWKEKSESLCKWIGVKKDSESLNALKHFELAKLQQAIQWATNFQESAVIPEEKAEGLRKLRRKDEFQQLCLKEGITFNKGDTMKDLESRLQALYAGEQARKKEYPVLGRSKQNRGSKIDVSLDELISTFHDLSGSVDDLIKCHRRIRFLGDSATGWEDGFTCSVCGTYGPSQGAFVLAVCGHTYCNTCKERLIEDREATPNKQRCLENSCMANSRDSIFVPSLEMRGMGRPLDRNCSSKVINIIGLIINIPDGDRAIIFEQYEQIRVQLCAALLRYHIPFLYPCSRQSEQSLATSVATSIEAFKQGQTKVLILDPMGENAAGSNLQVANHIIFASPLADRDHESRRTIYSQAMGRCERLGQKKTVNAHLFVTLDTIEQDLVEMQMERDKADGHVWPFPALDYDDEPAPLGAFGAFSDDSSVPDEDGHQNGDLEMGFDNENDNPNQPPNQDAVGPQDTSGHGDGDVKRRDSSNRPSQQHRGASNISRHQPSSKRQRRIDSDDQGSDEEKPRPKKSKPSASTEPQSTVKCDRCRDRKIACVKSNGSPYCDACRSVKWAKETGLPNFCLWTGNKWISPCLPYPPEYGPPQDIGLKCEACRKQAQRCNEKWPCSQCAKGRTEDQAKSRCRPEGDHAQDDEDQDGAGEYLPSDDKDKDDDYKAGRGGGRGGIRRNKPRVARPRGVAGQNAAAPQWPSRTATPRLQVEQTPDRPSRTPATVTPGSGTAITCVPITRARVNQAPRTDAPPAPPAPRAPAIQAPSPYGPRGPIWTAPPLPSGLSGADAFHRASGPSQRAPFPNMTLQPSDDELRSEPPPPRTAGFSGPARPNPAASSGREVPGRGMVPLISRGISSGAVAPPNSGSTLSPMRPPPTPSGSAAISPPRTTPSRSGNNTGPRPEDDAEEIRTDNARIEYMILAGFYLPPEDDDVSEGLYD